MEANRIITEIFLIGLIKLEWENKNKFNNSIKSKINLNNYTMHSNYKLTIKIKISYQLIFNKFKKLKIV